MSGARRRTLKLAFAALWFLTPFVVSFVPERGAAQDCSPDPQGTIAFSSVRDGNSDIYVMGADGSNIRRVTSDSTRELEPSWDPDGRWIAYQSQRPHWRIFISRLDGTSEKAVTNALAWSPSWSPDGKWIAFSNQEGVHRVTPDGEMLRTLTSGGGNGRPAWSPDGRRIAFHSTRYGDAEIMVMSSDGSGLQRLTYSPGRDFHATWSPDGSRLVFASDREGNLEIFTMADDGTDVRKLTDDPSQEMLPTWSPDGEWIAFVSDAAGDLDIHLMRVDGSCQRRLTMHPGEDSYPSWLPQNAQAGH